MRSLLWVMECLLFITHTHTQTYRHTEKLSKTLWCNCNLHTHGNLATHIQYSWNTLWSNGQNCLSHTKTHTHTKTKLKKWKTDFHGSSVSMTSLHQLTYWFWKKRQWSYWMLHSSITKPLLTKPSYNRFLSNSTVCCSPLPHSLW